MNIQHTLQQRASDALRTISASILTDTTTINSVDNLVLDPLVRPASKPQFGDYQINGMMGIAKKYPILQKTPRELAEWLCTQMDLSDCAEKVEVAGPGFINVFLRDKWLADKAQSVLADTRLDVSTLTKETVVVDYSAPNIAKSMHVGHLRSTIIGDAMVRVLAHLGQTVVRANHVGDWGTQFGMLIANLEEHEKGDSQTEKSYALHDLEAFYRESKTRYDSDADFAQKARQYVVKLQAGDAYCLSMWQKLVDTTVEHNQAIYQRLNVTLTPDHLMGESLYNSMLPEIVADLLAKGIAQTDQGAVVVFLNEFKNKEGEPMGVIIRKQDGGYLYATTDIASVKYRYEHFAATRLLYYVDSRQQQHLQQAWSIARLAGYVPETVSIEHHAFGMMLGQDGRPFKTRTGGTVSLESLLDEAEARALSLIQSKSPDLDPTTQQQIAQVVGIGAIKYADLSKNRLTDYIFDWDGMLAFEGNTAPYLQYAYARILAIFRRADRAYQDCQQAIQITNDSERRLVLHLIQFDETLKAIAREGNPHFLCTYLYQLAGYFSQFYEHCPILQAEPEVQASRFAIAALCARTLKQGLDLLGIETLEKM